MDKPLTPHSSADWLEKVWMEVQAEIDYETAHPQWDGETAPDGKDVTEIRT